MEKIISSYKYKILSKKDRIVLLYGFFGFFIGQVVFFSFANPFFAPYLSCFFGRSNLVFSIVLIPLLMGVYLSFNGMILYTYILIGILMFLANNFINYQKIRVNNRVRGVFCGISVFLGGTIPVFFYSMSAYFAFYFCIFTVISLILPTILYSGFCVLTFKKSVRIISIEETISISIIISSILLGVLQMGFNTINLFLFLSTLSILIVSNSVLKNQTITFAFIICLVPFSTGKIDANQTAIILLMALSSMITNKKTFIVLTLSMSLLMSYLYIDKTFFVQKNILAILLAILSFLLLPDEYYKSLQASYGVVDNTFYPYQKCIKDYTSKTLIKYSEAFNNLSNAFTNNAFKDRNSNIDIDMQKELRNNVCTKVCLNCENYKMCFEQKSYTTEMIINLLIEAIVKNDNVLLERQVQTFQKICKEYEYFINCLYLEFDICMQSKKWQSKIEDNKIVFSEQLKEVSEVFLNVKNDIENNIIFLPKYEKMIFNQLELNKIYPNKVLITKNQNSIYKISIELNANINDGETFRIISKVCSTITNKNIRIIKTSFLENGDIQINLEEQQPFIVDFNVSVKNKNEDIISGDSHITVNLEDGRTLLALSDGMGSGLQAQIASSSALNLFEDFLQCGFDKSTAIKLINNFLILNNKKDSFTTLDAIIIDLYNASAEFIKIGAVQSFILRQSEKQIISIDSKSLPIGILNNVETEVHKIQLKEDDYLIILTDGVLDVISSYKSQETWIKKVLKNFDGNTTLELSEYILKEALILSKNKTKDDMTVIVGKIKRRIGV